MTDPHSVVQMQTAVTVYLKSKQLLLFASAVHDFVDHTHQSDI